MFPCESVINLDLESGDNYSKYYTNELAYAIREDEGVYDAERYSNGIPANVATLTQSRNMYEYNTVYSQQNTTKVTFPEPLNWESIIHEDTLVKRSEEKVSREEVDSYIKFLTDNERLLPTHYGPINDIFEFRNYTIVFMDHAIGTLSIDERVLLPIQNNTILELGAGNDLQFFDFISNKSGSVHPQSIEYCGDGFIWYDAYLGSLGYYNGQTQDLGLVKGMSSKFKTFSDDLKSVAGTYYNNHFLGGNVISKENKKYKETLIGLIRSEFAELTLIDPGNEYIQFSLNYSPGHYYNMTVIINGEEYIADRITHTSGGYGLVEITTADNPTLNPSAAKWVLCTYYHIYYKELSSVFSFSSINNAFAFSVDIFPTWMIEYKEDLYDVYGRFDIYKENSTDNTENQKSNMSSTLADHQCAYSTTMSTQWNYWHQMEKTCSTSLGILSGLEMIISGVPADLSYVLSVPEQILSEQEE